MKATLEREVKLAPGPDFRSLEVVGRDVPTRVLVSTYHDTDDLRLARGGITLRRREQDGSAVWQLKLPADGGRTELEWPAGSPVVPERIANLAPAHSRGRPLSAIATLRTTRAGVVVEDAGVDVAEVTDDDVEVIGDNGVVRSFDEIEIELLDGDAGALRDLERTVRRSGAVEADGRPKLYRSIGFEPERTPGADTGDPREALRSAMLEQFRSILANDPRTRLGDPMASTTSGSPSGGCGPSSASAGHSSTGGGPTGSATTCDPSGAASAVRDLDVLHAHLAAQVGSLGKAHRAGGETLLADIDERRRLAQVRMIDELSSPWYLALLNRLEPSLAEPRFAGHGSVERAAANAHGRAARKVAKLPGEPSDAALHEVRKAVKRARYAAEVAKITGGSSHARYIKQAKRLQDLLGEHQDAIVAQSVLADIARDDTAAAAVYLAAGEERRRIACRTPSPAPGGASTAGPSAAPMADDRITDAHEKSTPRGQRTGSARRTRSGCTARSSSSPAAAPTRRTRTRSWSHGSPSCSTSASTAKRWIPASRMAGHVSPSLPPISVGDEDGVRVVTLAGEHDLSSTVQIAAAFTDAAAGRGPVLADLTSATFIDSSVIAELVSAHELCAPRALPSRSAARARSRGCSTSACCTP